MRLLASGRDADVFEVEVGRVLRRYRDEHQDATAEAVVMRHVATAGYPVPTVYDTDGPDIVMDRVDGPTMMEAILDGSLSPAAAAEMLADLLHRLHAIAPPPGLGPVERVDGEPAAGDAVLHLDLHPLNVLITPGGPVVIDWCNARSGPPGLDRAVSALILAQVVNGEFVDMGAAARELFDPFLAAVGPLPERDLAVAYRSADPNMTADELDRLTQAAALLGG
ncbi:phosphotransferase [Luteipulveratus mongoliensis]|uniref:Aminoglycoside phosphotransferase domain-containing protein n=1 Tax=Luteipulveratus mongoliensis TaxID=571913 RepID=A0A0K1JFG6_9MICO|nr:phosphotransferase [Luteipulveratus mongoliensis]AKU15323.1 hypothetical protein VV02_04695 [Luteipulveratus mongoliensis]